MPFQEIRCSIENCHYWGQGNKCDAQTILVTSDDMSDSLNEKIDAPQANNVTQTPIAKCKDTCCKTFVQKNSFYQNMDGVMKRQGE